jgi:hypothetical protein
MFETLIDLGDMTQRGTPKGDIEQAKLFSQEWNKRYPEYRSTVKSENHDFGPYYGVKISSELFEKSFIDTNTFKDGIETAAGNLAEELDLDF